VRDILAEIVDKKRAIVAEAKKSVPLDELKANLPCGTFRMAEHFRWWGWGLIAECKLQSPAKGYMLWLENPIMSNCFSNAAPAIASTVSLPSQNVVCMW